MRILWFTNTISCYVPIGTSSLEDYNGGGWIASAEKMFHDDKDITLGVSFTCDGQLFKQTQNSVTYYPIPHKPKTLSGKIKAEISKLILSGTIDAEERSWNYHIARYKEIIADFKPDLIHVWGSEYHFGLVSLVTDIPVILHIQGILNPYLNAYLPPFISWRDSQFASLLPKKLLFNIIERKIWDANCYRERTIHKSIKFYLGRTDWDKRVAHILNPKSQYFHVDEILRDCFYEPSERQIPDKLTIVTTISQPLYKGFDLVLKTAKLLKENLSLDFEWKCYGNIDPAVVERAVGIRHEDVCVTLMGVATQQQLREAELNATCYFHPSYIDNSPNSLCEAQMLGVPVIATNVGGIPSLVEDRVTGFLIPANDPYQGAYLIEKIYKDRALNIEIGENERLAADKRHNKETIRKQILAVYNTVLN